MADQYSKQADAMRKAFRKKPEEREEEDGEESSFASKISSGIDKLRKRSAPPPKREGY